MTEPVRTLQAENLSLLQREYFALRDEINAAISHVLESGHYKEDEVTAAFEREFADLCEVDFAVGTASGTMALVIGLQALGVGAGDEVIAPAYTCTSTTSAISLIGARVRLVDVDAETLAMDPSDLHANIGPKTRAVIPVHMFGLAANMDEVKSLAQEHDLKIVEDATLAVGARYHDRPAGSLGHVGAFSFAPSKVIGSVGWGGMVVTDSPEVAGRARQLAGHGPLERLPSVLDRPGVRKIPGYNAQLSGLLAAALRVKLQKLDGWLARRREIASLYDEACDRLGIRRTHVPNGSEPSRKAYPIFVKERDSLLHELKSSGLPAKVYFDPALHLLPIHSDLDYEAGSFPVAEYVADHHIALPVHPYLTQDEVSSVIDILERYH